MIDDAQESVVCAGGTKFGSVPATFLTATTKKPDFRLHIQQKRLGKYQDSQIAAPVVMSRQPVDVQLTSHLLNLDPGAFSRATQHPWLRLIGQGELSEDAQLEWLLQDRLYAMNYAPFIGGILSKTQLPNVNRREKVEEWKLVELVTDALINIKRELSMFEDILEKHYGWSRGGLERTKPSTSTLAYQSLFTAATGPSSPLLAGLTALWATEKCYLEAWRFAKGQRSTTEVEQQSDDVVRNVLIPNWTSPEFVAFVDGIGELLDELSAREDNSWHVVEQCENIWRQVLDCEERFWPRVER